MITNLASNRQRQRLKVRCKRYDRLVNKLRSYLRNEINRCLNKIVKLYKPAEIVIEKLDFNNPNLTKRMNRLVRVFGKGLIKAKLKPLNEEFGIKVVEVNPAYTSKQCSVCGYIDRGNRRIQEIFKCKFCNTVLHADVNGARNHLIRSSDRVINIYRSKKAVLRILVERFLKGLSKAERKYGMPHSKAKALLSGNSYFKSSLAQAKGFL